ncbi:MAG: alpha/beta fold hydrolase [Leptospiraceae bacterium]
MQPDAEILLERNLQNIRPGIILQALTLILTSVFISGCLDFQRSQNQIQDALKNKNVTEATIPFQTYKLNALAIGPVDGDPVLFIHGSPGSWDNYLDVISNLDHSLLIFFDRPGFGQSVPEISLPDLEMQANAARAVLRHFSSRPAILVGHSYGGPIALEMSLRFQEPIQALVLVGASVDPELERLRWYNHLTTFLEIMVPGALVRSNDEMIPLRNQLESQKRRIMASQSSLPSIYVLHGTEDDLVPVENVNYIYDVPGARSNLICVQLLSDQDHFIPWKHPGELADLIREAQDGTCTDPENYSRW